jgi:hypothetical protein
LITLPLITSQPPQQTQLASQLAKATESTSQPMPTPALETTSQPKDIKKGPLLNTLWLHVATVSLLQEAFLQQRYECPRSMEAERMIFWMAAACA